MIQINKNSPGASSESTNSFPQQKLPYSRKGKNWRESCVNWIINNSSSNSINDYENMRINYDLYNSIIDEEDFSYVTKPYGGDNKFPARFNNYNIITPKLKLLEGEEIKRPFNFRAVAVNSEAVSQMQEKRKELLMQFLEAELVNDLTAGGFNMTDPSAGEAMNPEQIEKYMNYSEADIRESTANKLLAYFIKKLNLEFKFNKGFKDALISDKEYYLIGIDGGEPYVEVINPLDFDYDMGSDLDFVQDGQWARYTKYATINQIIDEYYEDLSDNDISRLENRSSVGATGGNHANSSILSMPHVPSGPNQLGSPLGSYNSNHIPVTKVEWKSLRKIGFLTYYDEFLQEQEMIVGEDYEVQEELGESIEWSWISEVWEGTRIANDIFVRIRPKIVQFRSIDNPSICKLGFVGATYNSRNSKSTSLVDLAKNYQYLYNIIMYRMELEIAKAKGKKMIMDIAQIPKSAGMDMEKWMYYFESVGIGFINSFEEGKGLGAGRTSSFNQFSAVDMSLSQSVGQYINILSKIEEQCETIMGVSRQRQGSISSNETVGGVERAVIQSSHITEPIFFMHNEIKKHVLTHVIETAKVVMPESTRINYIGDDMTRHFLEITEEFIDADYGVFITNSAKEVKALEDMRALAQQAAANGLMSLSDLVAIVDSGSMADIKASIKETEKKAEEAEQMQHERALEVIEQQGEQERLKENEVHDRLDHREHIKGEYSIEREYIRSMGFQSDNDLNNNQIPDVLEMSKLRELAKQHDDKMSLENKKLDLEKEKIKAQERIAKTRKSTSSK